MIIIILERDDSITVQLQAILISSFYTCEKFSLSIFFYLFPRSLLALPAMTVTHSLSTPLYNNMRREKELKNIILFPWVTPAAAAAELRNGKGNAEENEVEWSGESERERERPRSCCC